MQTKVNKTTTKLSLLLITFILPVIISWILFYYHDHFHFKTTNHGTLINPPIQISDILKMTPARRSWQILYVPAACIAEQCDTMMHTLSQLRKALGKDYKRVDLTFMMQTNYKPAQSHDFSQLVLTKQQYHQLEKTFIQKNPNLSTSSPQMLADKIYLVDPAHNVFMFYATSTNPMNILKDLKHLLGVSQIG